MVRVIQLICKNVDVIIITSLNNDKKIKYFFLKKSIRTHTRANGVRDKFTGKKNYTISSQKTNYTITPIKKYTILTTLKKKIILLFYNYT